MTIATNISILLTKKILLINLQSNFDSEFNNKKLTILKLNSSEHYDNNNDHNNNNHNNKNILRENSGVRNNDVLKMQNQQSAVDEVNRERISRNNTHNSYRLNNNDDNAYTIKKRESKQSNKHNSRSSHKSNTNTIAELLIDKWCFGPAYYTIVLPIIKLNRNYKQIGIEWKLNEKKEIVVSNFVRLTTFLNVHNNNMLTEVLQNAEESGLVQIGDAIVSINGTFIDSGLLFIFSFFISFYCVTFSYFI
jgi:hypothetical protein